MIGEILKYKKKISTEFKITKDIYFEGGKNIYGFLYYS